MQFTKWYSEDFPAKSTFNGNFREIWIMKRKIYMNMNPRIAKMRIFNATIYSSFLSGEWNYSTFRGHKQR